LTTETFGRRSRIVANTIDRKERHISSIDQAGQQAAAVLDAAIVVKKISTETLDHESQPRNGALWATHVEQACIREIRSLQDRL
jgi:hypothetical protein